MTRLSEIGFIAEGYVAQYLESRGYNILDHNYRKPWGEIDLIAEKSGTVRFVEVKAVSREIGDDFSREMDYRPEELIDTRKLRKLARTSALYMESRRDKREYQIDAIGVILDKIKRIARCRFFEQALEDNL